MTEASRQQWTFLSNHAHVLVCIAQDPDARVRDVAGWVGITERAVQRILRELEEAGVVRTERVGRRNHYAIDTRIHLRHPLEAAHTVRDLLDALADVAVATDEAKARRAS